MKISSLHWNGAAYGEKLQVSIKYQNLFFFLKKGWFSYVRVSLKRDECHIYMAKLSLQSL